MQISTHQGWAALQGSLHHCLGQVPLERASGREMCRELGCQGAFSRTTPARELGKIRKQRLSREGLVRGTMNLWCSYMRGSGGPTGSSEAGMGFHRCHRLKLGECAFYLCEHQIGTVSGEECNLGWGDSWNWNNFQAGVRVKGPYISQQTWKGHPGNESRGPERVKRECVYEEHTPAPTPGTSYQISSSNSSIPLMSWSSCLSAFGIFV